MVRRTMQAVSESSVGVSTHKRATCRTAVENEQPEVAAAHFCGSHDEDEIELPLHLHDDINNSSYMHHCHPVHVDITSSMQAANSKMQVASDLNIDQQQQQYAPMQSVSPLSVHSLSRHKLRDSSYADDGVRVRVEFYNSENTFKEQLQMYFFKDHTISLYIRIVKFVLKILACLLYVIRVVFDQGPAVASCYGCDPMLYGNNRTTVMGSSMQQSKFDNVYDGPINWSALFWVDRKPYLWALQTTIALICFCEAILLQYLSYKNNILSLFSFHFILEIVTNVPFIVSIPMQPLRNLFVPAFLNSWLAKQCLEAMFNDLHIVMQSSALSHRLTLLTATLTCLIFTTACGFQHAQRAGGRNVNLFESIYFVVVTFSTVGYGDLKPETWPSQMFTVVMIVVALIVLPTQFEQLAYFWIERQRIGACYTSHANRHEKHVVVCSTTLRADTIMDFLNEFYAHPLLQSFSVVLLSPCELDTTMKMVLQTPTWNHRVVYIQGSALRAVDLIRARMQSAEACFILAARNYNDRSAADEHTILRSWAIRDFSPSVPQYVQIFRTENKIHVAFAEHVVCDDEFKYALLANNCLCPGTSTLVTLLLHTSRSQRTPGSKSSRSSKSARRAAAAKRRLGGTAAAMSGASKRSWFSRILSLGAGNNERQSNYGGSRDNVKLGDTEGGTINNNNDNSNDNHPNNAADNNRNYYDDDDLYDDYTDFSDYSDAGDTERVHGDHWKRLYGKCSGNEIYHIRLSDSRFFGEYAGKSFTYASFHSHRKFGVALIGIQTDMRGTWPIMLNPGPSYVLKTADILFYINLTKEENSTLMPMMQQSIMGDTCNTGTTGLDSIGGLGGGGPKDNGYGDVNGGDHGTGVVSHLSEPPMSSTTMTTSGSYGNANNNQQMLIRIEASSPTGGRAHTQVQSQPQQQQRISEPTLTAIVGPPETRSELQSMAAAAASRAMRHRAADMGGATGDNGEPDGSGRAHDSPPARKSSSYLGRGFRLGSRNNSTLELATLAGQLRKGSNISITSTRSRDASPTRLKQVVSGLAVKMKRVKLGKSLTHLTIPKLDYGAPSSATSSTESFVNARGRRPSIAPVPAMMGESEEQDSDHEREQESYFSSAWQSANESSAIVKGFPPCATYVGVSPTLCYLLEKKKPPCCLQLTTACEHCPYKNARQYNWSSRCIILASDFASNGIYNFLVPLRAHFHNAQSLRPIVLLLERKPSSQFIDAISWFPMVYWMPGLIDSLDDLIKAGINLADSVVVTNKESTNSAEEDYLADCNTIVAVQTMFKLFPSVGIITELSQSSNMRFMQFRAHDVYNFAMARARAGSSNAMTLGNNQNGNNNNSNDVQAAAALINSAACIGRAIDHDQSARMSSASQQAADHHQQQQQAAWAAAAKYNYATRKRHVRRHARDYNAHAYKFRLPFAAGNVFSASMLDTLLYQAFVKDYMITMVRLLLGIDQAPGSGFLSSMRITRDDLWIRTYGRLYQRLCSTSCEIPIGIYRNEPLEVVRRFEPSQTFGGFASQQASYEQATEELERQEITNLVRNRLQDLGMPATDYDDTSGHRNNTFSYVIINPNCDLQLKEGDLIYLIRPSPIHSRKLFMHRANSVRLDVANRGAANATGNSSQAAQTNNNIPQEQQQQQQQCYTSASLIKSCVSDGDIKSNVEAKHNNNNKNRQGVHISIKVDDDDDTTNTNDACCIRRSSCSDAPTVVPNINSMPPMSVASVVPNCSATNGQRSTIGSTNKSSCVLKTTQTSNNGTPIVVATTAPSTTATTTTINQQQSIVMMTTTTTTREHTAGNTFMSATRV